MILIVGATGSLGGFVARKLLASGEEVRVMTRDRQKTDDLASLGAKVVRGDLRDPESLQFAVRGARAVIAAAHSILGRGELASELIDDAGHRALIDAAKEAGVEHFIYTSVMDASPSHPVDFWRTKAKIERYLDESGLERTILRPSAFMEVHAYQLIGEAVATGKRVTLFGPGRNPRNFVAAEDVANAALMSLRMPELRGQTIEIGGPENLTARQVVEIFERVSGRKAKVMHVPLPIVRVMSRAIRRVHPGIARIMRSAVLSETTDQSFDSALLRTRLPMGLTRLEDWARARLGAPPDRFS